MRFLALFLCLGLLHGVAEAQILTPVKWETSIKKISTDEYHLVYTAKIDDGWAIYSQYLESDEGPIPTNFEYDAGAHFELLGKNEESGNRQEAFDAVFQMNLIKFKKKAIFTQKVKVTDTNKPITGYLTFMTCDDTRCLPPTDVDFSFDPASAAEMEAAPKPEEKGKTGAVTPEKEPAQAPKEAVAAEQPAEQPVETPEPTPAVEAASPNGLLQPVSWTFDKEKIDENTYDLILTADLEETWNLYSQFTEEGGPIPTTFYFDEATHYSREGIVSETGKKKEGPDPLFGGIKVIKFTEGPVVFKQRIKVSDPSIPISGAVEFMTCDDTRCLPPTEVPFKINLLADGATTSASAAGTRATDLNLAGTPMDFNFDQTDAETTCNTKKGAEVKEGQSLWLIFILGFGGGLIALLTPCVFPMIPLTVSYFTKSSTTRAKGISNAITYGLSIIVIYVALGLAITGIFGADALNLLSTNAWFNIFFALLFIVFAFSFFGYFEITLPSSWSNRSDAAADKGGVLGIFFMAFTLSLVSFSCTGPIIGTLLVETATGGGPTILGRVPVGPLMGMFGFALALALPFALFAAFPSWLNSLPRSGGWMNSVKVTLGFVEIALAMKFLSVADLTMGWKFLPYELFLAIWILCAIGLALYYLGYLRFPHDSPVKKYTPTRISFITLALAMVVYLSLGFRYNEKSSTFATPNILSGLAPPAGHSYILPKECPQNINCFKDFNEGVEYAREENKPILLDFTGHGCVNCRRMEDNVWGEDGVYELINEEYVLISLYVDDREKLEEPYTSPLSNRTMRTVGNKWADFQAIHFNRNSQPYYVLLAPGEGNELKILNQPRAYTPDVAQYEGFLECGLERFKAMR